MEWQEFSTRLRDVLKLAGSPVSVTYSMEPAVNAEPGKHAVCRAILGARNGQVIDLNKETSSCPGGTWHLGLGPKPTGDADRALKKFLVDGEKLFCSIAAFNRALMLGTQPPLGLADHVIISPLEKADRMPDLVLFVVNPEQACRLIQLVTYWDGISPKTELVGAGCHQAIAYPLVSGEVNVTFMDWTARRSVPYRYDELIVSVPYHRIKGLVEAIGRCTAGLAEFEDPSSFLPRNAE
jgi:uncharacterized protein (DUF169 family)